MAGQVFLIGPASGVTLGPFLSALSPIQTQSRAGSLKSGVSGVPQSLEPNPGHSSPSCVHLHRPEPFRSGRWFSISVGLVG